ncbi:MULTISPECIES: HRDC domain-containing protein [Paenarthrobacter]|jgi:ribonuclease D|uniref:HRDC domain-containing protein n=1 Tax=Paenarthrobacter TaxID=1742992 RepID=UPI00036C8C8B|nr:MULTISPECIES: HRDC domain-containing protein [Paenarthrobacter]KQQ98083.1 ribonuclease D [Arthrobacter sp. Leaf145]SKB57813.1 ribonuclease D [Arthrobacter sp. 31Cvi3.1E]MBP2392882.1 ribonuclease D [Paenarthrobacter nicotinovorans]MDI2020143.1 Ribonuclease D [Paenarthrobacter nicotinovorans]QOT20328.1 ribonuclease D [Paenarthrobacter sp. YJN-D]
MTPENLENTTAGDPVADPTTHIKVDGFDSHVPEVIDLDTPREGVPLVIDTPAGLERCAAAIAAGTGPAGVDAERASGFRYGQRAFLVQIRREGAGTWLIDPEPFDNLDIVNDALRGVEWILHAATQDLPCLSELGMWPDKLFDTELAARLAGLPRVGLAAVIEQLLGFGLAKEHSAADWSTRPLPEPWLRYAALDVEVLAELREELIELLEADGKLEYAEQEFAGILAAGVPAPRVEPWRKTSGLHQIRDRRQLAAVRELWQERDQLARKRDVAPGRLIPDSALVAAAKAMPTTVPQLLATKGFHGRSAQREAPRWLRCITNARSMTDLPPLHLPTNAPPPPRVWADRDPEAAARLATARPALQAKADELNLPVENLLTPDYLRRIAWRPPTDVSLETVSQELRTLGAREWQIAIAAPILTEACLNPSPLPTKESKANEAQQSKDS